MSVAERFVSDVVRHGDFDWNVWVMFVAGELHSFASEHGVCVLRSRKGHREEARSWRKMMPRG